MKIEIMQVFDDTKENGTQTIIYKQDDMWCAWTIEGLKDATRFGAPMYMNDERNDTEGCSVCCNTLEELKKEMHFSGKFEFEKDELSWVRNEGNLKYVVHTVYSKESDMTFIIEDKYVNNECLEDPLISEEVVGFIHGNVDDINVIKKHYRELKAEFHDEYYVNIMQMLADIRNGINEMGNDNQDILNSHFTLKWSLNGREIELGWGAPEVQALEAALQDILDEE